MLLLGGSAVVNVNAITGMNICATSFLILLGVCIYVALGGLCTTFLCDYSQAPMMLSIVATDTKTNETCIVVLKGLGTWKKIFLSLIEGEPYLLDVFFSRQAYRLNAFHMKYSTTYSCRPECILMLSGHQALPSYLKRPLNSFGYGRALRNQ
ncbi:uncharacterized protein HD556DRAFT_1341035 [Suillus plorans]|uniref:Uncharacterized protein n=1 Tax=Suillus plorans TaxID=116603 RepID=A0A9P7DQZ1_9AGAM|nr:uncharacterized protein HD556DRAFT_1341035 [Suillus plorans]KAG1800954.1 hypothetical protein HD556DRAFT_1341035 [Suillus plorans]